MLAIKNQIFSKINFITIIAIVSITILGFGSKFYNGPINEWVNNSLSGMFYVIFWCLVVFLFFKSPIKISIIIFLITVLLEFMQLWHPPLLERIRSTFLGRTLIGNSFVWTDIIYYFVGCIISYIFLNWLTKKYLKQE
ncbi:DUF2809 domain-containing protein [Bacteroidota bacterium]